MRRLVGAFVSLSVTAATTAAQPCPPRFYRPPVVGLTFRVEACDYLGALADRADASANCDLMLKNVNANAGSRVHVLERGVSDTLRGIFRKHFGFLDWTTSPRPDAWVVDVRLVQPGGLGTPPSLAVALRRGTTRVAQSEPLRFEEFDLIDTLSRESATATRDRWVSEIDAILETSQALNRKKLIESVFRHVPLENLSTDPVAQTGNLVASIPIKDRDIRVEPDQRPTFGLEVDSMVHESDVAHGSFKIGKCALRLADQTYSCRVVFLAFGQDTQPPASFVNFFRASTLRPPKMLYIVEYEPAKVECRSNGVFVQ